MRYCIQDASDEMYICVSVTREDGWAWGFWPGDSPHFQEPIKIFDSEEEARKFMRTFLPEKRIALCVLRTEDDLFVERVMEELRE